MALLEELLHPLEERRPQRTRVLVGRCVERLQRFALSRVELVRDLEDEAIAPVTVTAPPQVRHAFAAQPYHLEGLASRRDLELRRSGEHGHVDLGPERELGERDREIAVEVGALASEQLVLPQTDEDVQIPGRSAVQAPRAL